jgi:hypothetical protein
MLRSIKLALCCFLVLVFASFCRGPDLTEALVGMEGNASFLLQRLLQQEGITEQQLSYFLPQVQKKWIATWRGNNGVERCDLQDTEKEMQSAQMVLDVAEQWGLFSEYLPTEKQYCYALCLGAFAKTAKLRLEGLIDLWKEGVRFDNLIFLGGQRSLRKGVGEPDAIASLGAAICGNTLYETETDMLKLLWLIKQQELPEDMKRALAGKVVFVDAKRGFHARPSTEDTFRAWLKDYCPEPGTILMMSSRGFAHYQYLVGKKVFKEAFPINAVTPPAQEMRQPKIKEILDTTAKCLYEIEAIRRNG